jgi:hypothetical protein
MGTARQGHPRGDEMRLQGQRSNTALKLLMVLIAVLVVAAIYLLYLAPR